MPFNPSGSPMPMMRTRLPLWSVASARSLSLMRWRLLDFRLLFRLLDFRRLLPPFLLCRLDPFLCRLDPFLLFRLFLSPSDASTFDLFLLRRVQRRVHVATCWQSHTFTAAHARLSASSTGSIASFHCGRPLFLAHFCVMRKYLIAAPTAAAISISTSNNSPKFTRSSIVGE